MNQNKWLYAMMVSGLMLTGCGKGESLTPVENEGTVNEGFVEEIEENEEVEITPKFQVTSVYSTDYMYGVSGQSYSYAVRVSEDATKQELLDYFYEVEDLLDTDYKILEVDFSVPGESAYSFYLSNMGTECSITMRDTYEKPSTDELYDLLVTDAPTKAEFGIAGCFTHGLSLVDRYSTLDDVYDKTFKDTSATTKEEVDEAVNKVNNYFKNRNPKFEENLNKILSKRN